MPFDPTQSDPDRICTKIESRFETNLILQFTKHDQKMISIETESGNHTEIKTFLENHNLRTEVSKLSSTTYEITATCDQWKT